MADETITILLADDHELFRSGLRTLLEAEEDLEVIGEADDGRKAVELARDLEPDLVVMDISMPNLNGIDATRQIHQQLPDTQVLSVSMYPGGKIVLEMLRAGAQGYLPKNSTPAELLDAVRTVSGGKVYLSPKMTDTLVEDCVYMLFRGGADGPAHISLREREVLQLLTEGKTTKQVGLELHISAKTVESHRLNIMNKLGMHSIAELTKYAVREGLTPLET